MPIFKVNSVEIPNQESENKYYCGDEAEINAAITDIGNDTGVIELKSDVIYLDAEIAIDGTGSVVVNGNGTIIDISSGDINGFNVTNALNAVFNNIKFEGGATDNGTGIYTNRIISIRNCTFNNIKTGIEITVGAGSHSVIENNLFTEIGSYGIYKTDNTNSAWIKITKNKYINSSAVGTFLSCDYSRYDKINGNYVYNAEYGVHFLDDCYNNQVIGNIFELCDYGIKVTGCPDYSAGNISGNIFKTCDMGVRIESNSDFVLMTGNIFEGCTTYGVSINDAPSTENTIIGNTFIDCDTNIQDAGTSTYTQANNSA